MPKAKAGGIYNSAVPVSINKYTYTWFMKFDKSIVTVLSNIYIFDTGLRHYDKAHFIRCIRVTFVICVIRLLSGVCFEPDHWLIVCLWCTCLLTAPTNRHIILQYSSIHVPGAFVFREVFKWQHLQETVLTQPTNKFCPEVWTTGLN